MKIEKFEIINFKNLEKISFEWEDLSIIIGGNNTGKSSILEALNRFLSGKQVNDKRLFRNDLCDKDQGITFIAHFNDLTDSEKSSIAVKGRMHGEKWILKKEFWLEGDENENKWRECYYSYSENEEIEGWPNNTRKWDYFPSQYKQLIEEVKSEVGDGRVTAITLEILKEKIRIKASHAIKKVLGWNSNPGGGGGWKSNANSILPEYIFVPAVHEATAETQSKESTTYGKIINLIVERKLSQRSEVKKLDKQIKRVKALFRPDPEHPEWEQADEIKDLENDISNKLSEVISAKAKIETKLLDIPSLLLPATELWIDDGYPTLVHGQGHGLQRTLIISLLQILNQYNRKEGEGNQISRSVVFAIEEPEIYLHPQMVRKMKDVLVELSNNSFSQVIFTTHSPVMIDMAHSHKSIVRMEIDSSRTITAFQVMGELFSGPDASDRRKKLRLISEFDPGVNELFFAKRVVLVEGESEIAALNHTADVLKFFTSISDGKDTTFINCRGKGNIPLFMAVLNHFKVQFVAVHDVDNPGDTINSTIQAETGNYGTVIGFNPDLEGILGYQTTSKNKPIKAIEKIDEHYSAKSLPPDYITKTKQIFGIN